MKKIESFSIAESFGWETTSENELMEVNGGSGKHDTYCGCYGDGGYCNNVNINSNNNSNSNNTNVNVSAKVPICGDIKPAKTNQGLKQSAR